MNKKYIILFLFSFSLLLLSSSLAMAAAAGYTGGRAEIGLCRRGDLQGMP